MSFDLAVFSLKEAPKQKESFFSWYEEQTSWSEEDDYSNYRVCTPELQAWFLEMKEEFPPMNGEFTPTEDKLEESKILESYLTDYVLGKYMIYAAFSYSVSETAYKRAFELAQKHQLGFFEMDGTIHLPISNNQLAANGNEVSIWKRIIHKIKNFI